MFSDRRDELNSALDACSYTVGQKEVDQYEAIAVAFGLLEKTRSQGGIVYVIGNGGSSGIASHFSNDLMKALKIRSMTLTDSNILTCLANDIGYENVFGYQLDLLMKPVDMLVAISSSGKSENILRAAAVARSRGGSLLTLSGFGSDNPLRKLGALNFWIDQSDYGLVETSHFFLLHTVVDLWNKKNNFAGLRG